MKAILIDPWSIHSMREPIHREVDYSGDYRDISKLISSDDRQVQMFATVALNEAGDTLYVDDEGLLYDPNHFIFCRVYGAPLAGKGLILGTDEMGESISPKEIDPEWIAKNVLVGDKTLAMNHRREVFVSPLLTM